MNANAEYYLSVREVGLKRIHQGMHCFVTPDTQNCGAKNLLAVRIDQYLHEALGFAFLPRSSDVRHGHASDQDVVACAPCFGFTHAEATQRRVREQPVDRYPVAELAILAIQRSEERRVGKECRAW